VKYAWIAEQGNAFALAEMCDVLDVSISGYRAWKRGGKPDRQRLSDSQMLALIRRFMPNSKGPTAARAWCASCVPEASRPARNGSND
jgi:putative transposase